ncbi:MAG: hypothetical protein DMG06_23810, partial [Acidobacteria bacterium]
QNESRTCLAEGHSKNNSHAKTQGAETAENKEQPRKPTKEPEKDRAGINYRMMTDCCRSSIL